MRIWCYLLLNKIRWCLVTRSLTKHDDDPEINGVCMLALFAIGSVSKYAHTVYMIEIMSYDAQRRFMVKVCLMLKIWMFEMLTDEKESYQGQGWLLHSIKQASHNHEN